MRRLLVLFAVALISATITYSLVSRRPPPIPGAVRGADLTWIRTEFGLSDEQFAAVRRLHDEYAATCAGHCADIVAARRHVEELEKHEAGTEKIEAARQRVAELEGVCNRATREHLHRVAAVMPPGQADRFLRLIEPHLAEAPHDGDRGLAR